MRYPPPLSAAFLPALVDDRSTCRAVVEREGALDIISNDPPSGQLRYAIALKIRCVYDFEAGPRSCRVDLPAQEEHLVKISDVGFVRLLCLMSHAVQAGH